MEDSYDIVVVGAGWFGLAAAKAYLEMYPDEKMAVFEGADTCGGTWGKGRLYPGLKSNNMIGTYEYPDFPMSEEKYGVKSFAHIPGPILHQYLTDFAQHFGVFERIQFNTTVDEVQPSISGWSLTVKGPKGQRTVQTTKLILATGLTSTPNIPQYHGSESFNAPFFHAKDFAKQAPHHKDVKNVVVVGGAKSAFDVSYAMVEQGAKVDMIIRPNGTGPVWIAPRFVTPFKKRIDTVLCLRWMTWMAPCPWGGEDGYPRIRNFLHGTSVGRWIVDAFWSVLGGDVITQNGYDTHPELKKLKPWHSAFWIGSGLSVLNYDKPILDEVKKGNIRVHIDNIDHLEPQNVVLSSGTTLPCDALVCSTGWKKESSFRFSGLDQHAIGLPYDARTQQQLNQDTDEKILTMFPRLRNQPNLPFTPPDIEPLRLYRFMIPPTYFHARSIAFAGMVSNVCTSITAAVQGIWIAAYLHDSLDASRTPQNNETITQEIMLHTQWGRWRYPCGYGAKLPDFVFEAIPYMDMLLKDLGLKSMRKESLWQDVCWPYGPRDYKGLVGEWKKRNVE